MRVVAVIGESGTGKTRFAGLAPQPYWIGLEPDGETTALRGGKKPNGQFFPPNKKGTYQGVTNLLNKLGGLEPDKDGLIEYDGVKIGSIVLDSLDAYQASTKYTLVAPGRRRGMDQQGWGELADRLWQPLAACFSVAVPVIWIAHVKESSSGSENSKVVDIGFALQGSIVQTVKSNASLVVHLVASGGKRYALTQPYQSGAKVWYAKDRHGTLAKFCDDAGKIDITGEDGYPPQEIGDALWRS